jgi:hypothetical protein
MSDKHILPERDARGNFLRMIDCLEEAASCARGLAFQRGQNLWLKVDERLVHMRRQIILLAETADKDLHHG